MDVRNKQKLKKRRTRRNLDELRKRTRSEVKSCINKISKNTVKLNKPKYNNQITSERLTLAFFNKTIKSKTITRFPLSRFDAMVNANKACIGETNNILTIGSNPLEDVIVGEDMICKQKNNIEHGVDVCESERHNSATLFSPLHSEDTEESVCEVSSIEHHYGNKLPNDSACSRAEIESRYCEYEKFMKELPGYVKQHFPALSSEYSYQEKEMNALKYFNNTITSSVKSVNINDNHGESVIQNPMDYIQIACMQSVQHNLNISASSSSSSASSQLGSNIPDLFQNSPEYQYFPHKLNQ